MQELEKKKKTEFQKDLLTQIEERKSTDLALLKLGKKLVEEKRKKEEELIQLKEIDDIQQNSPPSVENKILCIEEVQEEVPKDEEIGKELSELEQMMKIQQQAFEHKLEQIKRLSEKIRQEQQRVIPVVRTQEYLYNPSTESIIV